MSDRVSVLRAWLSDLFAGFEAGTWIRPAASFDGSEVHEKALAARDRLYLALHGDVEQEVVADAVAEGAQPPAPSTPRAAPAPGGLLPCPFCGGGFFRVEGGGGFWRHSPARDDCPVATWMLAASNRGGVAAWNRRAPLLAPVYDHRGERIGVAAPAPLEAFEGAADVLAEHAVELTPDALRDSLEGRR